MFKFCILPAIAALTIAAACDGGSDPSNPTSPVPPQPLLNRPPVIDSMSMTPFGIAGLSTFTFAASASDPDDEKVSYQWDLAGNAADGSSGAMRFGSAEGNGTARVTVTDSHGGTSTDTRSFVVGSMTGSWLVTTGPLAGASFNLTQGALGFVTGTFSLPGVGNGKADFTQPGRIDVNGTLTLRVKIGAFTDFNMNGTMSRTGRVVSGSLHGSGFSGQRFSMSK